jgi:hypothetical protein
MEGKEWVWDNGVLVEKDLSAWKRDIEAKTKDLGEKQKELFANFLSKL